MLIGADPLILQLFCFVILIPDLANDLAAQALVCGDQRVRAAAGDLVGEDEGLGAELAKSYLVRSKEIGKKLVDDGVSNSEDDVNAVLMHGFFWLYGPINNYV